MGNYDAGKDLIFGMADVSIMRDTNLDDETLWRTLVQSSQHLYWVILDTTFPQPVLEKILRIATENNLHILLEPVSVPRAEQIMRQLPAILQSKRKIDRCTPNEAELTAMYDTAVVEGLIQPPSDDLRQNLRNALPESTAKLAGQAAALLDFFQAMLVTCGSDGCLTLQNLDEHEIDSMRDTDQQYVFRRDARTASKMYVRHFPPPRTLSGKDIVSVNGAGDTLVGTVIVSSLREYPWPHFRQLLSEDVIMHSQEAATLTLKSREAVSPELTILARIDNYGNG